jgi:glutaredoxin 2
MSFVPTAYLKQGCPFSFKFLLFMTEAGLLDQIQVEELIQGEARFEEVKELLNDKLGKATFPSVQIEDGVFMNETDDLIAHFAKQNGINIDELQVVPFYSRGVFQHLGKLFMENKKYKEQYGELS